VTLPDYLKRLIDAADDLPLQHRMPQPTSTARRSAVLILFGEGPQGPDVLLIEKSAHLRSHAGQPAFPGGGVDPGDDFPIGTALREAEEEAGIDPAGVRVLATLQELFLPPSDRLVVPVVAWWDDPRDVSVGDPREVARVARVPLTDLTDPGNRFRVSHPSGFVGPAFGVAAQVRRLLDQQDVGPVGSLAEQDQDGGPAGRRRRLRHPVPQREVVGRVDQPLQVVGEGHSCTPRCSAASARSSSTELTGPTCV